MNMQKRSRAGVLALILALLALWAGVGHLNMADGETEETLMITALSVGKADALIIQDADQVILIDAGEQDDGDEIVHALKDRGIHRIDLFLVTHFDKDHVGGAAYVMEQMEVSAVLLPDYEGDRPEYLEFLKCLQGHPDVQSVDTLLEMVRGRMELTVYPAEDPEEIRSVQEEYDNDMSLVASIRYGNRSFLLTGDIEKTRIRQMLAADVDWSHDWIKMPHHGRYQKVLSDFLSAVSPKYAVICCSKKNPAEEKTLELLEEQQISVWDTSSRAVVTVCDGENITMENEP